MWRETICYITTKCTFNAILTFSVFRAVYKQQHENTDRFVSSQHQQQQQLELQHQRRHVVAVVEPADHKLAIVGMPIGRACRPTAVQD